MTWLNDLMVWLSRWFPRLVLVKPSHAGVWFGPGGRHKQVGPGLHWYWPITSEFTVVSMRLRSIEVASQLHGREAVGMSVQFNIVQPLQLLLVHNDIFATLDDRIQALLCLSYAPDKSSEIIAENVSAGLQRELIEHGVQIRAVNVIQRGRVLPLKNINDWASHAKCEL